MKKSITEIENLKEQSPFTPKEFSKFKDHKRLSERVDLRRKYDEIGKPKKSKRCGECGSLLAFDVYSHKETGEIRRELVEANFCKIKFCPMCAWLRTRKLANELKSVLQQIEDQRKVDYLFLTLTIKNPPLQDLRTTLKQMSEAFNKMTKEEIFKKAIKGYIRAFEFLGDKTQAGEAHPHIHAVLVVSKGYFKGKNYIKQEEWTRLWQKHLKVDYTPITHITKIKAKNEKWKESDSAIFETIKYCAKPLEVSKLKTEDFKLLEEQTSHIRQYNKGGLLKSIKPKQEDSISDDLWELMQKEILVWKEGEYQNLKNLFLGYPIS